MLITKENKSFGVEGVVVYSMVGMGMGVAFTSMEAEHLRLLERWIGELSGELEIDAADFDDRFEEPSKNEHIYVLNELIIELMRKDVISADKGKEMIQKLLSQSRNS